MADIQGRIGTDCSAGGVSLDVRHNLALGQPYRLNTRITDSSGGVLQDSNQVISGTIGNITYPLQVDLPSTQTLSATVTLSGQNDRPLYRSQAAFQCSTGFNSFKPGTPVQPQQPSLTLVEPALQGCSAGDTVFQVNAITEAGQSYYYGMRVMLGTSTLVDLYELDSLNGLPQQPGLNLWSVEADLPTSSPVQVELSLYDDQQRPRHRTSFDYICASSQPVQQLESTPLPFVYLPTIIK